MAETTTPRFNLLGAVRDRAGTHPCPRGECDGRLSPFFDHDVRFVQGVSCGHCDYVRWLSRPFPIEETSHA